MLRRAAEGRAKRSELAGIVPITRSYLGLALLGDGKPADAEPQLLAGSDALAPHSAYNRGLVVSPGDRVALEILPGSGPLAVEADGNVAASVEPGDRIELRPRPAAAPVVRLGHGTFYERVKRKLRLADSAEIAVGWP